MESKGERGAGLELVDKMSAGAVESVRVAASRSDEKVGELLRSSGENKRKKKSKPIREEEKADVKAFSGSFADYLTHLQEDEEERDHRKLNEKLKKAAALEAKKKAEREAEQKEVKRKKKEAGAKLSGREMFDVKPELFVDDEDAAEDVLRVQLVAVPLLGRVELLDERGRRQPHQREDAVQPLAARRRLLLREPAGAAEEAVDDLHILLEPRRVLRPVPPRAAVEEHAALPHTPGAARQCNESAGRRGSPSRRARRAI